MSDILSLITDYEEGSLDNDGFLTLFAELIKSGLAWSLQGSYGRTAEALIEQGLISTKGEVLAE